MVDNNLSTTRYNTPPDTNKYVGEFIVFFPDEKKPRVLFHSVDPEESYKEAETIRQKSNKLPTVLHISGDTSNVASLLAVRL